MKKIKLMCMAILSLFIFGMGFSDDESVSKQQLQQVLFNYLNTQLDDKELSQRLTKNIVNGTLEWAPRTINISKGDYILAYAFGNTISANGNKHPGDMNKQLADTVVEIYNKIHKPVYAQWEIAKSIGNRIPASKLHYINPKIDSNGEIIYLSTIGVAEDFVKQVGKKNLENKKVIIAGFRDHLQRCVTTSIDNGIDAYAPSGYKMPVRYDKKSGQPWTRDREKYILTDMSVRLKQAADNI